MCQNKFHIWVKGSHHWCADGELGQLPQFHTETDAETRVLAFCVLKRWNSLLDARVYKFYTRVCWSENAFRQKNSSFGEPKEA